MLSDLFLNLFGAIDKLMENKLAESKRKEKRKPRILIVGPISPMGGGVGTVNRILLESDGLNSNFEMYLLNTNRGAAGSDKVGTLSLINVYYFINQAINLFRILIIKRPDILHQAVTWGISFWKESFFMLFARCFGVKVIAHVHGSMLDEQINNCNFAQKRMMIAAFNLPNKIIVLSEYWRGFLIKNLSPTLINNIVIIPNSIDSSIAGAMEKQTVNLTEKKEYLILFLGWLCRRKGLLDALRAAELVHQRMPEVRFVFAGSIEPGPDKELLEFECNRAGSGGNTSFPGLVTGKEKIDLLSQASIFILPSYHENLPVAILEAMSMGLPVISTSIAGVPELIEDGKNGFLIQPGDYSTLADRIFSLIQDPALCQSMGKANINKIIKDYHPNVFETKMANVYRNILKVPQLNFPYIEDPIKE
ncbi:MAG: glycosyltransferase family 4 protein [Anaerolineaceae bacterium]|nr:glycosyltransferase family 4 protein [Anaerolineaceae bacterium]